MLKSLLSCDLLEKINSRKTLDTILDESLRQKYPKDKGLEFLKEARAIKQNSYHLTEDYFYQTNKSIRKVAISFSYTDKEQNERLEELFWEGLCSSTQNECVKNGWRGHRIILENLKRLEEHLRQNDKPNLNIERSFGHKPFIKSRGIKEENIRISPGIKITKRSGAVTTK